MSNKAREQPGNNDISPSSPGSDHSSTSRSPTSTMSRENRRHRKASDKGYGSTNSSLSESGRIWVFLMMEFYLYFYHCERVNCNES